MSIRTLGKIEKGFCYFNQSELIEVLSENNFDFDAIKKDWSTTGISKKTMERAKTQLRKKKVLGIKSEGYGNTKVFYSYLLDNRSIP